MKKIIPFVKDIKFNTRLYEITSISLENTLSLKNENNIDGEFIISGEYKMNEESINTEPFIYGIPCEINLDDEYEKDKFKIDIDDFKYEIINEETLRVNIDVLLEGQIKEEEIKPDIIMQTRNEIINKNEEKINEVENERLIIKDFVKPKEIVQTQDLFKQEDENVQTVSNGENKVTSIFDHYDKEDENYISYCVHIIRENDSIDTITNLYKVSLDDLKEYNNLDKFVLGDKIIIPYINNDEAI